MYDMEVQARECVCVCACVCVCVCVCACACGGGGWERGENITHMAQDSGSVTF